MALPHVPRVGLQYVIVVFSDHTYLLLERRQNTALLSVVFAFTCMSFFVCCLILIEIQACRSILSVSVAFPGHIHVLSITRLAFKKA